MLLCCAVSTPAQTPFKPPELISATDVQFPVNSAANGIVVVDVSLDYKGEITGISVPRAIASLTSTATSAIRGWKFSPATVGSTAKSSVVRVAFVFRPRVLMAAPPIFEPLVQPEGSAAEREPGYFPPGIAAAGYPPYPIDAAYAGTVVVQAKLNREGKVEDLKAIRAFNPFTRFALDEVKHWRFQPAALDGAPIAANIIIAFVYSLPIVTY
ncbi:MAG: energy transducer TonB, partial [Candidatus Acidiferrales bacterium]